MHDGIQVVGQVRPLDDLHATGAVVKGRGGIVPVVAPRGQEALSLPGVAPVLRPVVQHGRDVVPQHDDVVVPVGALLLVGGTEVVQELVDDCSPVLVEKKEYT